MINSATKQSISRHAAPWIASLVLAMTAWMNEKPLPPGLAAAGGFGVIDRAEPARALTDMHLDLCIPAAGRLVIDAFAGPVDIALDGAVGRGRDRSRGRRQQDGVGILRRLGGSENGCLLVADAPVPRRDEGALPHPGLGLSRLLFVGVVIMGNPRIGQGPAVSHQPFLDVLAVDVTSRHGAAAAVDGLAGVTGPALVVGMLDELVARGDPAGPAPPLRVEAPLIHRRRLDAAKADPGVAPLGLGPPPGFLHPPGSR